MTQPEIDDTDREILRLLAENARRPYSTIAEAVNLSAPSVSARVRQLEQDDVIRRFTVDLDLTQYENRIHVMVRLQSELGKTDSLRESILETPYVEHVFTTAEGEIVVVATPPRTSIGNWVQQSLPLSDVRSYDVQLLSSATRSAYSNGTESVLTCAHCGTIVGEDGLATRVGGSLQQFCCKGCKTAFKGEHEKSQEK
jgi:DNA-binding Lrp family transcriptional regulator